MAYPPVPTTILLYSPSLYWRLNDPVGAASVGDLSGNSRPGTPGSGVTLGEAGAFIPDPATSALFNTSQITSSYSPFALGSQRTFMGWAYRNNTSSFHGIFGSNLGGSSHSPLFRIDSGSETMTFYPDIAGNSAAWAAAWPGTGEWAHWALTYDDGAPNQAELFINGVSQGVKSLSGTHYASGFADTATFVIGNYIASWFWDGYMQDVAVFESILSAAQIQAIYNSSAFGNVLSDTSPFLAVEFDHTNDPTSSTETWTNITPQVVSYTRQPVRSNEFDQPGPAAASLVLRNDDARFIPDNTSGPYYGGLKKYRRFRIRALWDGVIYNRFWGYVVDWPQSWAQAGKDQTVTLQLTDAMFPLTTFDLGTFPDSDGGFGLFMPADTTGHQISQILSVAGAASVLDTGLTSLPASGTLASKTYALQRAQDTSATENGVLFADGGGTVRFHDRQHRIVNNTVAAATIGDTVGEVRYVDPQPQYGDVWPIVSITPNGGSVQIARVAAGTARYFQQTLNYPTGGQYLASDPTEAAGAANYLANRYSEPVTRINSVTLLGARDSSLWPTILGLDTSKRVLFRRRFLDNGTIGGTIETQQFVEGYGDVVAVGQDWRVQVPLSPVDIQSYWVIGTSALGETTALFY